MNKAKYTFVTDPFEDTLFISGIKRFNYKILMIIFFKKIVKNIFDKKCQNSVLSLQFQII